MTTSFWEIHFNDAGNTVVGNYAIATRLYKLATKQFFPNGWTLIAETSAEATRLLENVQLWHNCLTTIPAWRKVAELSHCKMEKATSVTVDCTCATFLKSGVEHTMLRDPACPKHKFV